MSCVGCGLFDPDDGVNPVRVNTSGTFGGTGLDFGADDTIGMPIYCSDAGSLRGPPEHDSSTDTTSLTASIGAGFSTTTVDGTTVSITLTNPSLFRNCSYLLAYYAKISALVTTPNFAFRVQVSTDGAPAVTRQAEYWGLPAPEAYSIEQILFDTISGGLTVGASVTFDITPGIDATAGGVGTFVTQVVRGDGLMVTTASAS